MLTKEPWFEYLPKRDDGHRWGWRPISWQGWVVTFGAIIAAVIASIRLDFNTTQGFGAVIGIGAVYYFIVIQTGVSQP